MTANDRRALAFAQILENSPRSAPYKASYQAANPDAGGSLTAPEYFTTYDNLSRVLTETDPLSQVTNYAYNNTARTVTTTLPDPDGGGSLGNPVTVKTYDARGLLISLLDPVGNETTWAYNGLGLATSETNELLDTRTFEGKRKEEKRGHSTFPEEKRGHSTFPVS